jgi:hypothetical protein
LDEIRENDPPPELPSLEEMIEDSRQAYSQISMYDYGLGKKSNQQDIADFYGWAIVKQILNEIDESYENKLHDREPGQISRKLWQRMKDIRAGRLPKAEPIKYKNHIKPKPVQSIHLPDNNKDTAEPPKEKKKPFKVQKRQRQKGDNYFLTIERGIIRNESYRKIFKGPSVVYEWLWANIVRDQWRDSKTYPIKEKYHDKGFLAYCSTYGKIAKECTMSKNTVHAYIKSFEDAGIIRTESYVPEGKKQGQTVFILGTWKSVNGDRVESYYRDHVFITQKPVKN